MILKVGAFVAAVAVAVSIGFLLGQRQLASNGGGEESAEAPISDRCDEAMQVAGDSWDEYTELVDRREAINLRMGDNWQRLDRAERALDLRRASLPVLERTLAVMDRYEECFTAADFDVVEGELVELRRRLPEVEREVWGMCMFMYDTTAICGSAP